MKKIFIIFYLSIAGLLLTGFFGCEGPAGPPGEPGRSVANLEGFAEGIVCGDCHNPDNDTTYYVWARKFQWEKSKHFEGTTFSSRNSAPCSGCHTSEGFIQRAMANFPPQVSPATWSEVSNQFNPTPVGCFACHSPHSNGDFKLRTETSVVLWSPMEGIPDQTIDMGKGNICLNCHQPRSGFSPKMKTSMGAADTLKITSSRWYPHYGIQGLMFLGAGKGGGFEYPGKTYANSTHSNQTGITQGGCATCHMAEPSGGLNGGHTNIIGYLTSTGSKTFNTKGCLQAGCHTGTMDVQKYIGASALLTDGMGAYEYVHAYLDTLKNLLVDKGILNSSGLVNGNNGSSASNSNPRTFIGPDGLLKAGALYNFFFIEHDASEGIHNSRYTIQLLNDSIEEMRKP